MKGAVMRKELEKVVMETIENPLMQTKWQELIKKSGEATSEKDSGSGSESGSGSGKESGGGKDSGGG